MGIPYTYNRVSADFMDLVGRAFEIWGREIRNVIEKKELAYVQTFEMAGEKHKIDFYSTNGKFTRIYQDHSPGSGFTVGNAPAVFYESIASIMQGLEKQVHSATADNTRTRTKSFLDSLGPSRGGAFFEVEIEGVNVGLHHGPFATCWHFYTAPKDHPLETRSGNQDWSYEQPYGYLNFTSSPGELLDRVIEATNDPACWHTVDPVAFLQAKQRLKGMFIQSKKEGFPPEIIKNVSVQYIGNHLLIHGYSLTLVKERSIYMEKFVIDNVEAIAEYILKCKRPKKSTTAAFFNKNSAIVKKARKLMEEFGSLRRQPLIGFGIPVNFQITIEGKEVSLILPAKDHNCPILAVNGGKLTWPYFKEEDEAKDKEGTQLLSTIWPHVEKFLQAKKEELGNQVIEHREKMVQKLKNDLAGYLLMAELCEKS